MKAFLGIDLGTTGCKAAVYSLDAKLISLQYLEIPLIKQSKQFIEQDSLQWWDLTQKAIRKAAFEADKQNYSIEGISISSQGISFVPIDEKGNALRNAISWLDTRADHEINEIMSIYTPEDVFQITGKRLEPYYTLPKLLWLKSHEPDVFKRTYKYLFAHDFLFYKLTGFPETDYTLAGGTLMLDLHSTGWWKQILDSLGIDQQQLPNLNWAGSKSYPLIESVAKQVGLKSGIMVTVGCQDQKCAAFGAGLKDKVATVSLGTASAITVLSKTLKLDPGRQIPTFPYIYAGKYVYEGVLGTSGAALKWLRDTFFSSLEYEDLDRFASESNPGSNGVCFYPHLSGAASPHWKPTASGVFTGLHLAVNRGDIVRSVLEGIAYQIRTNLHTMEQFSNVDSLVLFGGGAKSLPWSNIICQVVNKPVICSEIPEMANWGACILASKGIDHSYEGVMQDGTKEKIRIIEPVSRQSEVYDALYHSYINTEHKILE